MSTRVDERTNSVKRKIIEVVTMGRDTAQFTDRKRGILDNDGSDVDSAKDAAR